MDVSCCILSSLTGPTTPKPWALMTAAFDRVCQCVSQWINGNDEVKQTLALIILQHVDEGERDPERLADIALREWTVPPCRCVRICRRASSRRACLP
jgi:hypothetical protein